MGGEIVGAMGGEGVAGLWGVGASCVLVCVHMHGCACVEMQSLSSLFS